MNVLDVYLHEALAGRLVRGEHAQFTFEYDQDWIASGGMPVSASLPLKSEPYEDHECRPYFAGLLPEGRFLKDVAKAFAVSTGNSFSVLEAIGGECAGAVSLVPEGKGLLEPTDPAWMSEAELQEMFELLPARPLALLEEVEGLRLSLAGAQEKLPVLFEQGRIGVTRGVPPSTHIIKIPDSRLPGLVANEAYCLRLASLLGLDVAEASGWKVEPASGPDDVEFLLVTRYDREIREGNKASRLHQEDFCQALGVVSENKYESDGGPGLADCAELIDRVSAVPARDRQALIRAVLFNFLIGNNDAHGKNFSMLREGSGSPRLAPLYDLVSTVAFPNLTRKMAMKVGGENRPEYLRARHWRRFADQIGVSIRAVQAEASSMIDSIESASETAKEAIGTGFRGQPVISSIDETIDMRTGWLLGELLPA